MALCLASCDKQQADPHRVLSTLVAEHPCRAGVPPITHAAVDSLSAEDDALVITALQNLAAQPGTSVGLAAADTSNVRGAFVTPLTQQDSAGRPIRSYWSIQLDIRGKSYDAEVQVDQTSGSVTRPSSSQADWVINA